MIKTRVSVTLTWKVSPVNTVVGDPLTDEGYNLKPNVFSLPVTIEVWYLTQFYSVGFSQSRISVKNVFSTRLASVVIGGVLGPLRLASHTWQCLWIPEVSGSNAWEEDEGSWRALCQLKKLFESLIRGSCWEERKISSPTCTLRQWLRWLQATCKANSLICYFYKRWGCVTLLC